MSETIVISPPPPPEGQLQEGKILKEERKIERDIESLIPPKSPRIQIKIEEDISKDEDSKLEDLT